jgi:hypothetical protein
MRIELSEFQARAQPCRAKSATTDLFGAAAEDQSIRRNGSKSSSSKKTQPFRV